MIRFPSKRNQRFLVLLIFLFAFSQAIRAQTPQKFASWKGKAAVLELNTGEYVVGEIVVLKKNGVIFKELPFPEGIFPPRKAFYPYSKINLVIAKSGRVVYQSNPKRLPRARLRVAADPCLFPLSCFDFE